MIRALCIPIQARAFRRTAARMPSAFQPHNACVVGTRCSEWIGHYLTLVDNLARQRFYARDCAEATDVLLDLRVLAEFFGRYDEMRLFEGILRGVLLVRQGAPLRLQLEAFRDLAPLAEAAGAPSILADRLGLACWILEKAARSADRQRELDAKDEAIVAMLERYDTSLSTRSRP